MAEFVKNLYSQYLNKSGIVEALTFILAFSLCFPKGFSAYTLGAWFAACVIFSFGHWRENIAKAIHLKAMWPSFALLALFCLGLLSATYASDSGAVFHRLFNARFAVFCIPAGVILANVRVPLTRLLKCYVLGVSCFVLYSFLVVTSMMNENYFLEAFVQKSWDGLTYLFYDVVNRAYTNTNVVLALFSLAFLFITKRIEKSWLWLYALMLVLLLAFLLVNTSRMVLGSALVVAAVLLFSFATSNKKIFYGGLLVFVGMCCLVLFTENRVSNSLFSIYSSFVDGTGEFSDSRYFIWKAAYAINPHTYLYGYGENNVDPFLFQEYDRMQWTEGIVKHYLCHNQYIELYLELGLPGLFAFIAAMVLAPLGVSSSRKKFTLSFSLLFAFIMVTECYISRTAGAMFFAFFLAVVCASHFPEEESANTLFVGPEYRKKVIAAAYGIVFIVVCIFFFVYQRKTTETYSLAKSDDIVVEGEVHEGLPVYQLDSSCSVSAVDSSAFAYYAYFISRNHVEKVRFQIDCLVPEDFNGNMVMISNLDKDACFYDLKKKGTWQTLTLDLPEGDNYVFLNLTKIGVGDLSTLNGFARYSNPRWNVLK